MLCQPPGPGKIRVAIPAADPLDNAQGRSENPSKSPGFCPAVGGSANAQQDPVHANAAPGTLYTRFLMSD